MFGEGNLRGEIERKVKELGITNKVIMPGIVENIHMMLNAMDVFILPSRHEGLGIVLIEAQANGLPCFTSKGVVPEEARVTDLLIFLSSNRSEEWAEVILQNGMCTNERFVRSSYNKIVLDTDYDIRESAILLESCI